MTGREQILPNEKWFAERLERSRRTTVLKIYRFIVNLIVVLRLSTVNKKQMSSDTDKKIKYHKVGEKTTYGTSIGKSHPLGATVYPDGVNFSIFSKNSATVELWLFHDPDDAKPFQIIPLSPVRNI